MATPTPTEADRTAAEAIAGMAGERFAWEIRDAVLRELARARAEAVPEAAKHILANREREIAEAHAAGGREGLRRAVLVNGSTAYPLLDVLQILCDVADHALTAHSCDHHGYEVWGEARDAGRECIRELIRLATEGGDLVAPAGAGRTYEDGVRVGREEAARVVDGWGPTMRPIAREIRALTPVPTKATDPTTVALVRALGAAIPVLAAEVWRAEQSDGTTVAVGRRVEEAKRRLRDARVALGMSELDPSEPAASDAG